MGRTSATVAPQYVVMACIGTSATVAPQLSMASRYLATDQHQPLTVSERSRPRWRKPSGADQSTHVPWRQHACGMFDRKFGGMLDRTMDRTLEGTTSAALSPMALWQYAVGATVGVAVGAKVGECVGISQRHRSSSLHGPLLLPVSQSLCRRSPQSSLSPSSLCRQSCRCVVVAVKGRRRRRHWRRRRRHQQRSQQRRQ